MCGHVRQCTVCQGNKRGMNELLILLLLKISAATCQDPTPAFGLVSPAPQPDGRFCINTTVSFSCLEEFELREPLAGVHVRVQELGAHNLQHAEVYS